eukprot:UN07752
MLIFHGLEPHGSNTTSLPLIIYETDLFIFFSL